ncbi:MAG: hypothetical protein ACI9SC_002876 [Gammaproteobacteria bacterium]|jgi:uncharacterized protein (DUF302 family)
MSNVIHKLEKEKNMYYVVSTKKSFEQASTDLAAEVVNLGFGVLNILDLGQTLRSKGIDFEENCRIFEVCNPKQAASVLSIDMRLNMALPCRISVFTEKDETMIGMIKPGQMLSALSENPALLKIANEVEAITIDIINNAK